MARNSSILDIQGDVVKCIGYAFDGDCTKIYLELMGALLRYG